MTNPYDITSWLNSDSRETRIISDIEGGEIYTFATKKGDATYNGKILVAGDLIDSTTFDNNVKNVLTSNIHNLIHCVTNQQIQYVLGNRDLNKIKVFHLTTLKPLQSSSIQHTRQPTQQPMEDYFKMFNEGTIPHGKLKDAYENLKKMFSQSTITFNAKMQHWYTFWSDTLGNLDKKNWKSGVNYYVKPFFTRFEEIFGADNIAGTISAQNLLKTIPAELEIIGDPDYIAFIVLYVFRIMLIPTLQQNNYNIKDISSLRGLLIKFYNKGHAILHANHIRPEANELIVFSHGGLTSNFGQQYFRNLDSIINKLYNPLTDAYMLKGGAIQTSQVLIDNINRFNTTFKQHIANVEKEILSHQSPSKPSQSMLFLLIVTAPFNCDIFSTKLRIPVNCRGLLPSGSVGPVVSGIREVIKNPLRLSDKNLLQIFGHYSTGCGVSITDVSAQTPQTPQTHRSVLINLDVTNTYSHTNVNNYNNSRAIITYRRGDMHAYTHIATSSIPSTTPVIMGTLGQEIPQFITINEEININIQLQLQKIAQDKIIEKSIFNQKQLRFDPKAPSKPVFNKLYFHGFDTTRTPKLAVFTLNQNYYGPGVFGAKYILIDVEKNINEFIRDNELSNF
jgi:hypothetical protein